MNPYLVFFIKMICAAIGGLLGGLLVCFIRIGIEKLKRNKNETNTFD